MQIRDLENLLNKQEKVGLFNGFKFSGVEALKDVDNIRN